MKTIGISEFKAGCIQLLKDVQRTREPLVVTHRGRPLARIEPVPEVERKVLGSLRHMGEIRADLLAVDFTDEWEMCQE
ncbi:MAG: type II toxin-antitoxin system Phd/YefM family antitoxin [Candidatus Sericytochromatia bacterium]|nr:type II toxin-antitoxin system Phd/YefM family antitoxin [Candidatus Tanganyikabacteria bacterium]